MDYSFQYYQTTVKCIQNDLATCTCKMLLINQALAFRNNALALIG